MRGWGTSCATLDVIPSYLRISVQVPFKKNQDQLTKESALGSVIGCVTFAPAIAFARSLAEFPSSSFTFVAACSSVWLPGLPDTWLATVRACSKVDVRPRATGAIGTGRLVRKAVGVPWRRAAVRRRGRNNLDDMVGIGKQEHSSFRDNMCRTKTVTSFWDVNTLYLEIIHANVARLRPSRCKQIALYRDKSKYFSEQSTKL